MINRNFWKLWGAYTISAIGDWAYRIAIPLIIFDLTGSAFLMSAAYAATFAPFIFVMPFAGVFADLLDRKKLLWISDLISAIVACAICLYLASGFGNIYILLSGFAMLGILASLSHPAFQGFIPNIVEEDHLAKANSMVTSSDSVLNLVAPAISGLLIAAIGAYAVIWVNAASFVLSTILILLIRVEKRKDARRCEHILAQGFQGFA